MTKAALKPCILVLGAAFTALAAASGAQEPVWLLVDTNALKLTVMGDTGTLRSYENIAIGSNGATRDKRVGDEKTPLGEYRINDIRPSDRFHVFVSIDYPRMDDARRALEQGGITAAEHQRLDKAWRTGRPPPQNTGLGGHLGIHGLGAGNTLVHELFNWTNGCIALSNEQLDDLLKTIGVGTRIIIR